MGPYSIIQYNVNGPTNAIEHVYEYRRFIVTMQGAGWLMGTNSILIGKFLSTASTSAVSKIIPLAIIM